MRLSPLSFALFFLAVPVPQAFGQAADAAKQAADETALFDRMRAAYYHPGKVSLKCDGQMDFSDVLKTMGGTANSGGAKALQELKVHLSTTDGSSQVTFTWPQTKVPEAVRTQLEVGAKQLVESFFDAYWPIVNADVIPAAAMNPTVVGTVDNGFLIAERFRGGSMRLTVLSSGLIRRTTMSLPTGQETTSTLTFTPAANPVAGDMARLTGIDIDQQVSGTRSRLIITWADQDVDGVHVPGKVNVNFQGVINLPVTFSGCSVTRAQ